MNRKRYGKEGLGILKGPFEVRGDDGRLSRLLEDAARRPAEGVPPITTLRSAVLSNRPTTKTVGLTKYSEVEPAHTLRRPRQTIAFYSDLLGSLSDKAAEGVVAHELAHAWLNEHIGPEESGERESAADLLARKWGFGVELDALDDEAETVN